MLSQNQKSGLIFKYPRKNRCLLKNLGKRNAKLRYMKVNITHETIIHVSSTLELLFLLQIEYSRNFGVFILSQKEAHLTMIKKFQELFHQFLCDNNVEISEDEEKKLAVYGILYEAARSDHVVEPSEQAVITEIMESYFSVTSEELADIQSKAEALHLESTDMFQITREVRKHLSREERLGLLDDLWRVAFADGYLDPQEASIIRRLSDLLGLEHKEFIDSKLKVATKKDPR